MTAASPPPLPAKPGLPPWLVAAAVVDGLSLAWIDSRPGWDDTGLIAGLLFATAAFWSLFARRYHWVVAIGIGLWIPAIAIARTGDLKMLGVLVLPFAGAYGVAGIKRMLRG